MSSQVTMYACGHTWNTGFNGTPEEQERLKKIVNEKWSKEPCVYCQHFKQEQEMQALDKQLEQTAWAVYLEEGIDPLEATISMPAVKIEE